MVKILFCDFGNTEYVAVRHVKPISQDLLIAVNVTKCYINGMRIIAFNFCPDHH